MDRQGRLVVKSYHDGRQSGPQGPWVPPNLLRKSVPPKSASRRQRFAQAALTAASPPVPPGLSSMVRTASGDRSW